MDDSDDDSSSYGGFSSNDDDTSGWGQSYNEAYGTPQPGSWGLTSGGTSARYGGTSGEFGGETTDTSTYANPYSRENRTLGQDIAMWFGANPYGTLAKGLNIAGPVVGTLVNPLLGAAWGLGNNLLSGNYLGGIGSLAGAINPVAGLFSNFLGTAYNKGMGGIAEMFAKGALNSELAKTAGPYAPLASLGVNALFNAGKSALSDSTPGGNALSRGDTTQVATTSTPGSLGGGGSSYNTSSDDILKKLLYGGVA